MDVKILSAYAAYSKDDEIRMKSSSGAIFSHIANYFIEMQGVVYGVAMSDNCQSAEYVRCIDKESVENLRGAKYLQAKVGSAYLDVRKDLENGKKVLFTGTGCQINGLKLFLGKEYNNLFCIDIICHGVPTINLWKKYVDYIEKKNKAKLIRVNFRCKKQMNLDDAKNKNIFISRRHNSFMYMYLKNYCLRPSCYECKAKEIKMADITLGDFWGIECLIPELDDGKGISLVLLRTEKGKTLFEFIKNCLWIKEFTYEEGVKGNPSEFKGADRPAERTSFFEDLEFMDYEVLVQKYAKKTQRSKTDKIKEKIKYIIKGNNKKKISNLNYGLMLTMEKKTHE